MLCSCTWLSSAVYSLVSFTTNGVLLSTLLLNNCHRYAFKKTSIWFTTEKSWFLTDIFLVVNRCKMARYRILSRNFLKLDPLFSWLKCFVNLLGIEKKIANNTQESPSTVSGPVPESQLALLCNSSLTPLRILMMDLELYSLDSYG